MREGKTERGQEYYVILYSLYSCGVRERNEWHRLMYLNHYSLVFDTILGIPVPLGGGSLLEEVHHWERDLRLI